MTPEQERQATAWMRLAQAGDQDAYASVLVLLTSETRRFAHSRLGAVAWIDDVVQETLMTVHRARATYDASRPFAPWFYAIATTRMIDVLRRERRIAGREIVNEPAMNAAVTSPVEVDIDLGAVRDALRALPARQREIVEGLKLRDESVKDIAGRLNMTAAAVKISAHRGYKKLRSLLGDLREED